MKDGRELVDLVINAHGGIYRWNQLNTVKVHVSIKGITWPRKGHPDSLDDIVFTANLHAPYDSWTPIFEDGQKTYFNGLDVALLNVSGEVVEESKNARKTFDGHELLTPWSRMQLVYFVSYATWNYMTTPFLLAQPGVHVLEMDPWEENGETWRRLQVIFPDYIPTHSTRQVFYFSQEGLLKRHDYWPEVLGNNSAVHYYSGYKEFNGIKAPTVHRIYPLNDADQTPVKDILLVSLDIFNITYE
ncbi:hypothetical protein [Mucilaginibacter psychrotolerans]|uniref:Uncharacterized protein n=1 Tax=Mucilaginibacter psychrotolerans TaxID=1524096 RepID=A0A4Y8SAM2_9SPHI|nr:hypothetical protein [Mucilaginibacter psychrotolerans]TFF35494.1 hypothetical protein E2R66_18575 [Mucilaginibacter psychrotolerans]